MSGEIIYMIFPDDYINQIVISDCLVAMKDIPDNVIQTCITSPPYWGLRDYKQDGQYGLEKTPEEYVAKMVGVFREVRRILRPGGTLWLNLGDSYVSAKGKYSSNQQTISGKDRNEPLGKRPDQKNHEYLKDKDLCGIPWRVAFALQADGWWLRQDIIWSKPNPMPESVTDRCTKSHEYIFLLSKSASYYFDNEAIQELAIGYDGRKNTLFKGGVKYKGFNEQNMLSRRHERWKYKNLEDKGQKPNTIHLKRLKGEEYLSPIRNRRSVWEISTSPYPGAHFATFPPDLVNPCILAGSKPGDIVLDPFGGSGTTAMRAKALGRKYIHIDLGYKKLAEQRLAQEEIFK